GRQQVGGGDQLVADGGIDALEKRQRRVFRQIDRGSRLAEHEARLGDEHLQLLDSRLVTPAEVNPTVGSTSPVYTLSACFWRGRRRASSSHQNGGPPNRPRHCGCACMRGGSRHGGSCPKRPLS